jgi:hypothetical protein
MKQKIQEAIGIIEKCLEHSSKPAIGWSGGKDSMAMLDLVQNVVGRKLPVIFFREQWQPAKYAFQNRIIEEWGLEIHSWQPTETAFQQNDDEFEVQNLYVFDKMTITCPTGITSIVEGVPWTCAMDIFNRPRSNGIFAGWDSLLIGHKRCDSDPIYGGDAGTRIQMRINPGQANNWYPLQSWTHDDVFEYCEQRGVPIQESRYEKTESGWREKDDKTHNCDYVHACTKCIDRRESAPQFVQCPKLGLVVENISKRIPWADQSLPSFMKG